MRAGSTEPGDSFSHAVSTDMTTEQAFPA